MALEQQPDGITEPVQVAREIRIPDRQETHCTQGFDVTALLISFLDGSDGGGDHFIKASRPEGSIPEAHIVFVTGRGQAATIGRPGHRAHLAGMAR